MKNKSIWLKNVKSKKYNVLSQNIEVDVLIIGGGMTGLNTALRLQKYKGKIALVEQNTIGSGVSSRTTGKINYLQEVIYQDLEKMYDFDVAEKYLKSQRLAIKELKKIIYKYKIKCDFDKNKAFVFTNDKKEISKIKYEKKLLEKMGISVEEYNSIDKMFKCKYAISVDDTYVFNCVKYMYTLKNILVSNNFPIYENTRINKISKEDDYYICYTDKYKIKTKKLILACHYPCFIKPYFMPIKVATEKSYIVAGKVKRYKKINYITSSLPCHSIRYHKDKNNYIIYASNSHDICNDLNENKNYRNVLKNAKSLNIKVDYYWTNDDLITVDKMPYIGFIQKDSNSLLIGTGYNTWGMTNSVLASILLSDLILGKKNEFEDLFSPLRVNIWADIDKYMSNIGSNVKSYLENKIIKNKYWYNDNLLFENRNGKNIATYKDDNGTHTVLSTCPHLGCTLIFNEVEKTWDCPCHASRFDIDGKCIKGPSCYDISYHEEK